MSWTFAISFLVGLFIPLWFAYRDRKKRKASPEFKFEKVDDQHVKVTGPSGRTTVIRVIPEGSGEFLRRLSLDRRNQRS